MDLFRVFSIIYDFLIFLLVFGIDFDSNLEDKFQMIGLSPQAMVLYNDITVEEQLKFFAILKGIKDFQINTCILEVLLDVIYALNFLYSNFRLN